MIQNLNDSQREQNLGFAVLSGINVVVALASGAFAAVAIASPSALVGSPVVPGRATDFYVDMYAIRAFVITAGIVAASLTMRRTPRVTAIVLAGGGLVQLGDVVVAARLGTAGLLGATVAAAVHLASAAFLTRGLRRRARPVP